MATLSASITSAEGAQGFGEGNKNADDEELHMVDFILIRVEATPVISLAF